MITLNGAMALLRYFTEFTYNVVLKQLLGLHPFQNLLLIVYELVSWSLTSLFSTNMAISETMIVYDHINYDLRDYSASRPFGQNNRRQQPRVQSVVAYAHVS